MGRILLSRLRQIAPAPGWLLAFGMTFVLFEGFLRYLEFRNIPIFARLPVRPGMVILLIASTQYGLRRAVEFHPIWSEGYRTWLESTPWTSRKPLPMGPIELVWEDGLVVGSLMLLGATLPEPHSMALLSAFLLGHLSGLTMTLWMTRVKVIGYVTAFGLGLAVWLFEEPIACVSVSTLLYLIDYEGLWRGLAQFPWKPPKMPNLSDLNNIRLEPPVPLPCGWPFDRMIRDVLSSGISRIDSVVCCVLGTWWLFVLSSFLRVPEARAKVVVIPFVILLTVLPIVRVAIYIDGHHSPMNLWGRIITGRWLISAYDQIFVAPLLIVASGPLAFYCLRGAGLSVDNALTVGSGIMLMLALVLPPRLRRWRLIGHHRIVAGIPAVQSKANAPFVQVG